MANQTLGTKGALQADLEEFHRKLTVEAQEARIKAIAAFKAADEFRRLGRFIVEDVPSINRYSEGIKDVKAYIAAFLAQEHDPSSYRQAILHINRELEAIEEGI